MSVGSGALGRRSGRGRGFSLRPWRPNLRLGGGVVAAAVFVLLAVLVRARWGPLLDADKDTVRSLNDYFAPRPGPTRVWRWVSDVFAPDVLRIAVLLLAAGLALRRLVRAALLCVIVSFGSLLASAGLKELVGRARPSVAHPVAHAAGASFPSGHALSSAAVALLLAVLAARFGSRILQRVTIAAGAVVVLAVGTSRVMLGVHYPSDVVAGWCTAVVLVALAVTLVPPEAGPRLADEGADSSIVE